jgi:hypothetical protein
MSTTTLRKVNNYFAERRNVIMNCRWWRQKVSNDVKMSLTTLKNVNQITKNVDFGVKKRRHGS